MTDRNGVIEAMYTTGVSQEAIARLYGLSRKTVNNIVWERRRLRRLLQGFHRDPATGLYVRDA